MTATTEELRTLTEQLRAAAGDPTEFAAQMDALAEEWRGLREQRRFLLRQMREAGYSGGQRRTLIAETFGEADAARRRLVKALSF